MRRGSRQAFHEYLPSNSASRKLAETGLGFERGLLMKSGRRPVLAAELDTTCCVVVYERSSTFSHAPSFIAAAKLAKWPGMKSLDRVELPYSPVEPVKSPRLT